MNTTPILFQFLRAWEGVRGFPALTAYRDSGGTWTLGYGHTQGVRGGDTCTTPEAEMMLTNDMTLIAVGVNSCVKVALQQYEFNALCSFAFNLGLQALYRSTMMRMVNLSNFSAAANEFPRWDYAGGKESAGLLKRRVAEMHVFLIGDYSARP